MISVLNHPHIIGYFTSSVTPHTLAIAMEYAAGGTLAEYLTEAKEALPEKEVSWGWGPFGKNVDP